MVIAFSAFRGSATDTSGAVSPAVTPTANLASGRLIVVIGVVNSTSGAPSPSCSDSVGNATWTQVGFANNGNLYAVAFASIIPGIISTSQNIRINFSATGRGAACILEFTTSVSSFFDDGAQASATGSSTSPTVTKSDMSSNSKLILGIIGIAGPNGDTFTQDSDYANNTSFGTTGGTASAEASIRFGTRISTLTSDTYNPTLGTSRAWIDLVVAISETAPTNPGTIAASLQKALFTGSATQKQTGTIVAALRQATASLTGVQQPKGPIVASLQKATFNANGIQKQIGSIVATNQKLLFAGTGTGEFASEEGAIVSNLQKLTGNFSGYERPSGPIVVSLQKLTFNAAGLMQPQGTIGASLTKDQFNANGQIKFIATIAGNLTKFIFTATAKEIYTGTISARLQKLLLSALGVEQPSGLIISNLQKVRFSAAGSQLQIGTIATALQELLFSGSGTVTLILTLPALAQVEGVTRNEVFKRFLRETGLGTYGVVSGVGGGATTTFDDVNRLKSTQFTPDEWAGGWARISRNDDSLGSAPENQVAPITAYDPTTNGRITVNPAFSSGVAVDDEYELWRFPSPKFVADDLDTVLREDIFLPCWSILSEAPDFDMEQDNILDWGAGAGTTLTKVGVDPALDNGRWLALTTTGGAAGSAFNNNEISIQPGKKYSVSIVCYNHDGNTLTLEAYDASNLATIASRTYEGRIPARLHFEFTAPSSCYKININLKHDSGSGVLVSFWKELCLFPVDAYDIALPWWVKNKNQIKGIFKLSPTDIGTDIWDASMRGGFLGEYEIRDSAFGRGQLRLIIPSGTVPGPLFIFGVRNETAYTDDNSDVKRVDENLLIACLAYKVFKRLKTFPNSNAMQTQWIQQQYNEWEGTYKRALRQQSERVENVLQSIAASGYYIDQRFNWSNL